MTNQHNAQLFTTGQIVATPPSLRTMAEAGIEPITLLKRHITGDWGDVCAEDSKTNDYAAAHGERILSSYTLTTGKRIWIITEWDRSVTTFLLPEDY